MIDDCSPAPGTGRCPGMSTRDILRRDRTGTVPVLLEESYEFLGDEDIAFEVYTSASQVALEHERMWSRVWQWACRLEHIPRVGDYYVYDIGHRSVIVTRTADGIKAFNNFCLHRGTQLRPSGTLGAARQFRCPFHGWTWSNDGTLASVPCDWDFPHVSRDEFSLPEARVGTWGGFVFVNFDPDAEPLEEYLGVLPAHFEHWDLADRHVEIHIRKRLPCNWKAGAEAFLEGYHIFETHSQAAMVAGDANASYDVFGRHVSRFVQTQAFPSPHIQPQPDDDQVLDSLFARKAPGAERPQRPEGWTARDVYAQYVKEVYSERYQRDFSNLTISEAIDPIQYFVFPNAFYFPGLAIPMVYRFRPDGDDPDSCIFDLLFMRPNPVGAPAPPPAEPFDLDVHDSYALVPGLDESIATIFDQDTANLAAQTRGFKGSMKRAQTLGNYQEVRTRHLHLTLRGYVDRPL